MDNYTRIPNSFIDDLKLCPYQFQILSIIVRKTDGWCKIEDGISLSQFEKLVSFKKNKIVNTIKELCELNLIEKTKHYNDDKKTYSYSTYKIHQGVVSENNKGSLSQGQGVVSEEYKQKKLITKETNTPNKEYTNRFLQIWDFYKIPTSAKGSKVKAYKSYIKNKLEDENNISLVLNAEMKKEVGKRHLVTIFNNFEESLEVADEILEEKGSSGRKEVVINGRTYEEAD